MTLMQERPATLPELVRKEAEIEAPQEEVLRPRRWTTAEYYALSDTGFFDDERVELLDGAIWKLPAQKTPHFYSTDVAGDILLAAFGGGFIVRRHGPITLEDGTEPDPDVVIVPGTKLDYIPSHPVPSPIRILVEVSDATLWKDRKQKQNAYARAGIADYWTVNLVNRQLKVYRDQEPTSNGHGYKTKLILLESDSIAPLSVPNGIVAVADLFPSPICSRRLPNHED